jgi:hypothetical protein
MDSDYESYIDYKTSIEPNISNIDRLWLDNIFNHVQESERIIFENDDFILIPNLPSQSKCSDLLNINMSDINQTNISLKKKLNDIINLHSLVFFKDPYLKSIRDINIDNILMITDSYNICLNKIKSFYNLGDNIQFYSEFHYRPSVWQLHLHIYVKQINSNNIISKKYFNSNKITHSLEEIIININNDTNYYKYGTIKLNN